MIDSFCSIKYNTRMLTVLHMNTNACINGPRFGYVDARFEAKLLPPPWVAS
jgi:hypothetical protein